MQGVGGIHRRGEGRQRRPGIHGNQNERLPRGRDGGTFIRGISPRLLTLVLIKKGFNAQRVDLLKQEQDLVIFMGTELS